MIKNMKNIEVLLLIFYIFFIFFFTSYQTQAQEITINVTAEEQDNSAQSVVVYDEQDLEESQKTTLCEFLQSQSFLYIAKGVDDSEIGFLLIRGFSTSRIAIFLDGVPISLNQINAMKLPLNLISKIVIYKGNVSALFGPNALGGAILVWTKGKNQGTISFGSFQFSSLLNLGVYFHFSNFQNDIFTNLDINAKINTNTYDNSFGKSDFWDIFSKFLFEYKNFAFSIFFDYFKKFLPNDIQFPYFNTYKEAYSILSFFRLNEFMISFQYIDDYFSCKDYTYNIDENKKIFYSYMNLPFYLFKNETTNLISNITVKFEYLIDETLTYENLYGGVFSTSFIYKKNFSSLFELMLSLSMDFNAKYSDKFEYFFMPSIYINLGKKINIDDNFALSFFTKIGSGYRLPSYQELYSSYGIVAIGNPELKPEKSFGGELGGSLSSNNFNIDLSFYYYYFDDFIVWIRRFDNRFKPINFAKGYNLGFDLDLKYSIQIGKESYIQFSPMISVIIPKILEGILILNEVYVPYVPLLNFIFDIDLVGSDNFRLKLELVYRGIRFITLENYNWFSPYFLINFYFSYYFSQKSSIDISLKNLLGTQYYDLLYYPIDNMTLDIEFSFYL